MKIGFFFSFIPLIMMAAVSPKYAESKNCQPCHAPIVADWRTSLHAKSHYTKNDLYRKTLEYMSQKTYRTVEVLQAQCAICHNPRIGSAGKLDPVALQLDDGAREAADAKLNAAYLKDGVNCVVCHNIDTIHPSKDPSRRGLKTVDWTSDGVMAGPFADAKSPYHKTVYRDHFGSDVNQLCFVCHYNGQSVKGVEIYTTGKEFESARSKQKCVDCHMSRRHAGIAATINVNGSIKERNVRSHLFMGARNGDILADALSVDAEKQGRGMVLVLKNETPHALPSGYGARQMTIDIAYVSSAGGVSKETMVLKATYADDKGKPTVPHLAASIVNDTRLSPYESRTFRITLPAETKRVRVTVSYRLVTDEVAALLGIREPALLKTFPVIVKEFAF